MCVLNHYNVAGDSRAFLSKGHAAVASARQYILGRLAMKSSMSSQPWELYRLARQQAHLLFTSTSYFAMLAFKVKFAS